MAKNKKLTNAKIIQAARKEFLAYGFEKASIRRIAAQVGIAPSSIYRHFKDKEELFGYFVEPLLEAYNTMCTADTETVFRMIEDGTAEQMWHFSDDQFIARVKFAYQHLEAFKLLLCCSGGTRYSNFQQMIVEIDVSSTQAINEKMKKHGIPVNPVDETDLFLITSGLVSAVAEMIRQDYSEEEAIRRSRTLSKFFNSGMKEILGL